MNKRIKLLSVMLAALIGLFAFCPQKAVAGTLSPLRIEPSETNNIPAAIHAYIADSGNGTQIYQVYLPGNVNPSNCFFTWDSETQVVVDGVTYDNGACPIPPVNATKTYSFISDGETLKTISVVTYQGSAGVQPVFIEVDETGGKPTIEQMDSDPGHETSCSGWINIGGEWYEMTKMKGRGNATWMYADDKLPYNITLKSKINFPGLDSDKTKKWSFLAEPLDHSLLCNRIGYALAGELGIGQDTVSADVWMNGEYQGCYTVTPKTDSFVSKDGYMLEEDNFKEKSVAEGGDPQFTLNGLKEDSGYLTCYNRITVKKIGDNLLKNADGEVDESAENLEAVSAEIKVWMQDAWDAIRSDSGYNSKGKYYTEYIDVESFAKMYLMQEYVKNNDFCAGSLLFYRNGTGEGDLLYAGPLWDLDYALGSTRQNTAIGKADDRKNGDRRSGEGYFINNVTEYKTSLYKTIAKHDDFMQEVFRIYNANREAFDNLPTVLDQMSAEIEASARMNHIKVNELSTNVHKYSSKTTLGSGQYKQTYLATTNSKSDWPNYVANLRTYISTRSLWFKNHYTVSVADGWVKSNGKWYYIENYAPVINGWVTDNGKDYYIKNYVCVENGWVSSGGKWYYIKNWTPVENGWVTVGGKYYYIKDRICLENGWVKYNGTWYYIKNWTPLKQGWVKYSNNWYYIRNYHPVTNTWITYNGTRYHFNGSGVCDRKAA